jgi:putative hydrolase
VTPVEALERVVHCLDRAHDTGFRAKAFVRALEIVRAMPASEVAAMAEAGTLTEVEGIGSSTQTLVRQALEGGAIRYLDDLEATTQVPLSEAGAAYRRALRGDLHLHSRWSDGGATIEAMASTAIALGHEYMVLTDHSPRLTVAHGLSAERLEEQLAVVAALNERLTPFRILSGIEVDILEDGSLDHGPEILSRLDIVVASVHNKLRMPSEQMTERMLRAVSDPHVDILGHCTGRLVGKRPPRPCSLPVRLTGRRWRSTADPSARTRRCRCWRPPSPPGAGSASIPTPTAPASSNGSRWVATGRRRPGSPSTGS